VLSEHFCLNGVGAPGSECLFVIEVMRVCFYTF
jgi:hypothetical protein